ncbi:hypothetical protein AVEN_147570-1 [Araneus ventricosus]|uniref:Uncharacterized protein n=1 Tax=Araneus ventricosus TaxID=182803 RepID=A0A4Y2RV57_ARAVE|nr:hypothetical protein AVEN_147570-1 [Araneus ventricosus]
MATIVFDSPKLRDIDKNEKNKFRCDWLEKKINLKLGEKETDISVGESIKKVDVSGKVLCILYNDFIYYGKRGFRAISDHIKTKKHMDMVFTKNANYSLPSNFFPSRSSSSAAATTDLTPVERNVPLCDRISNAEALILGVIAEHNLPFSMAPVLVNVSKALAEDKKALNHLSLSRNCASYKMKFGVAKTFLQDTLKNLQTIKFSLNLDEATSNNNMRVISVLASYFSPSVNRVVVEHLVSLNVVTVSSENIFKEISKFFESNKIPWENLVSILMDSCRVMRGTKSGVETRIRNEKAPHLLDIDGDSCHHIHNATKKFCSPFDCLLENLMRDIFYDTKWSADIRNWLIDICSLLNVKYVSPVNVISHRWLSCYDGALSLLHMIEPLTFLYYAFLSNSDKTVYFSIICSIYRQRNIDSGGRAKIKEILKKLSSKNITEDGKRRKDRITQKLFYCRRKTLMNLHFYVAALPLLKKYVCMFQAKQPLIHKLFEEQRQLFVDFLSCFMKQELLQGKSSKELLSIDVMNDMNHIGLSKMFIGAGTQSIILNGPNDSIKEEFLYKVKKAYANCAHYLQKKLPLASPLLKCISSIDPVTRGKDVTLKRLQKLPSFITNVLTNPEDKEAYALEIHQYQVDLKLPSPFDDSGKLIPIDIWWSKLFTMEKYTSLSKMVKAVISCFHGPQVEGTFNIMSDLIDKRPGRMHIETYSSIQSVKYKMMSKEQSAVEYFRKKDFLHDAIDSNMCKNLRSSRKCYQEELHSKKIALEKKIKNKPPAKKESNKIILKMEENSRLKHKRKLELLAQKIKNKRIKNNV